MGVSSTIQKILNGDGLRSAWAGVRRASYPLGTQRFIDAIDKEGFQRICDKYAAPGESVLPAKYLNVEEWMQTNVKRVRDLRIREAPPRLRILDLGSGTGYFLHVAKCLGHEGLGIDASDVPIFEEMFDLLGLERLHLPILPFTELPDLGKPFDFITAHMTCFNRRADGSHWGPEEWDFFLDDIDRHLADGGRMHFDLNVLDDGRHMADDVREMFRARGASVDRRKVYFPPKTGALHPASAG